MDFSQIHFARSIWLWGLGIVPLVWLLYFFYYKKIFNPKQLETFIDKHLLPYLLINNSRHDGTVWKKLVVWSAAWVCLVIAIAGPRWTYQEVETFSSDQSLVILLDLSQSMEAKDVKPSRLARAKQKIENLLSLARETKIGLIAFAADPHMITPLTDDVETIRHLLPFLETGLVYVQGSKLSPALEMASTMLGAEPGNNKSLLIISDGGFEDASAIAVAKSLSEKGIDVHAIGVGTIEGAPVPDQEGNFLKKGGASIYSKLENEKLGDISTAGNGRYFEADYSDQAERFVLNNLKKRASAEKELKRKTRIWQEHFYLLIFPILPIILSWCRKRHLFVVLFLLATCPAGLYSEASIFKNAAQIGKEALEQKDYQTAIKSFDDPYRKGVAHYRAGNFAEAEGLFRQSTRKEVAPNAAYNLGNSLVQQQKLKEAIQAYEAVLAKWPDHQKAKDNLEIVKKMLEQENDKGEDQQEEQDKSEQQKNESNEQQNAKKKDTDSKEDQNGDSKRDEEKRDEDKRDEKQELKDEEKQSKEPERQKNDSAQEENQTEQSMEQNDSSQSPEPSPKENSNDENVSPKTARSPEDWAADQWLNQISNEPKEFLKNKFYFESKRKGTKEAIDPW